MATSMPLPQPSAEAIDHFIDALWLEDGLAPLTLAAYRRDLTLFAAWLQDQQGKPLDGSGQTDLLAFMAQRHASTKATTANRRLSVLKRYFRWAVRQRRMAADPTLKLDSARQPLRVPKTLSEAQVERLRPFFPKSRGKCRVDDRRVLSGIIFIQRNGLMWKHAPRAHYTTQGFWGDRVPTHGVRAATFGEVRD
jgi:integrase/recombinase XerD